MEKEICLYDSLENIESPGIIINLTPVSMGKHGKKQEDGFLISYIPASTSIETLETRWEEGGIVFRDGKSFKEWTDAKCKLVSLKEFNLIEKMFEKTTSLSIT